MKKKFILSEITKSKIFWAVVAELLILLVCLLKRPDFFKISYQPATGMLYGSLIDIINRSAEITIIALGMTLVIALGGTDLSVGAMVAVAGAIALKFMRWDVLVYNTPGDYTVKPFWMAILIPIFWPFSVEIVALLSSSLSTVSSRYPLPLSQSVIVL